ncbi:hypothetical protein EK21DRAFT_85179 [Setomelanomma holmii]|uniref:Uncharacterized protein n=1 Tax=Setomelanomma holmii TaxID=210430 RepID=A0A9P4HG57_9PLEO|nr:hypothetical protein EK21DRAFT_85179 [Setomelanomma holmii]
MAPDQEEPNAPRPSASSSQPLALLVEDAIAASESDFADDESSLHAPTSSSDAGSATSNMDMPILLESVRQDDLRAQNQALSFCVFFPGAAVVALATLLAIALYTAR